MTTLPSPILANSTAAAARRRMETEDLLFLPVVNGEDGTFAGVVLRGALQLACASNGHDPESCPLGLHLMTDVDTCFAGDRREEVLDVLADRRSEGGSRARKERVRRSLPVIVLDQRNVPVGLLQR